MGTRVLMMGASMTQAEVKAAQAALYAMAQVCCEYGKRLRYVSGPSVAMDSPSVTSNATRDLHIAMKRHEEGDDCDLDDALYAGIQDHHDKLHIDGRERCRDHLADVVMYFMTRVRSDVACNLRLHEDGTVVQDDVLNDMIRDMRDRMFEGVKNDEFDVCDAFRHLTFKFDTPKGETKLGMLVDLHVHTGTLPSSHREWAERTVTESHADPELILQVLKQTPHDTSVLVASISTGKEVTRVPLTHLQHARVPSTCMDDLTKKAEALALMAGPPSALRN